MIVVIAAWSGPAWRIACLIHDGSVPRLYVSVEQARAYAQEHYPPPQRGRYRIFEFESVGADVLIRSEHHIDPA